jgi:hypothetical protein
MAQAAIEHEHRSREPFREQLVDVWTASRTPNAERDEHGCGDKRQAHGGGNGHGPVIGECRVPL